MRFDDLPLKGFRKSGDDGDGRHERRHVFCGAYSRLNTDWCLLPQSLPYLPPLCFLNDLSVKIQTFVFFVFVPVENSADAMSNMFEYVTDFFEKVTDGMQDAV